MDQVLDQTDLLHELEPEVARLMERHLKTTKEWFPHELIPYGRARDLEAGWTWNEDEADLGGSHIDDAVRSSLVVNLLTEDNLPYYFRSIESMFGRDGVWGEWTRRWTAEEGRHSMVIYGYLAATRAVDLVELERSRMVQVSTGATPDPPTPADGMAYVALQELATRIAHRNTGKMLGDSVGYDVMMRVAADENLHFIFYRDLVTAALEIDPSAMVCAIERQVRDFEMPGTGIPDFMQHALAISRAGIYDLTIHHEQILVPMIERTWNIASLEGLSEEAEQARTRLMKRLDRSGRVAKRLANRRAEAEAAAEVADAAPATPVLV